MSKESKKINSNIHFMTLKNKKLQLYLCVYICVMVIGIILDLLPCKYITYKVERIFTYNTEAMTSSLLTIWTIFSAIVLYYFSRKDEAIYGISNGAIIKKCFPSTISLLWNTLFIQLFTLIIANWMELPITLLLSSFMHFGLICLIFKSTSKITEADIILDLLIYAMRTEQSSNKRLVLHCDMVLYKVINNINLEDENDRFFLINAFMKLCDDLRKKDKINWNLTELSNQIMQKNCNKTYKGLFYKQLIEVIIEEEFCDETIAPKLISLFLLPILFYGQNNLFIDVTSTISDVNLRNSLFIQGQFCMEYLQEKRGASVLGHEKNIFIEKIHSPLDKNKIAMDLISCLKMITENEPDMFTTLSFVITDLWFRL